ncbi:MAG: hypothetical protein HOP30_08540 [Cyclobacteriaceae bacterium]|nr:hypothetical protein [Cyclobacteriaceae bacterium]
MNKYTLSIKLMLLLIVSNASAQQNLFNIPSGDITRKGKFFYQHQINVYSANQFESKSHLVYGLGKNWDVGLNLVDLPISFKQGTSLLSANDAAGKYPFYPLIMATAQKQFDMGHHFQVNIGTQIGGNIPANGGQYNWVYLNYVLGRYNLPDHKGYFIAGPYHANDVYFGPSSSGQHIGWMFGYEIPLSSRISLMGDFVSGQNKKSVSTIGGVYNISKRLQLCMAALLAYPNENLSKGAVIEINWYGYDFKD